MLIFLKLIFVLAVLSTAYVLLFRVHTRFVHRLLVILLGVFMVVLILQPELSTAIANFFGIGRGADLVFYISHLLLFYLIARQYVALQSLNSSLTVLTREMAQLKAEPPSTPTKPA